MRVFILGGTGMVGHKLCEVLSTRFDTWASVRTPRCATVMPRPLDSRKIVGGVDALNFDTVVRAITGISPDVVVNAIGIVKQLPTIEDTVTTISINSLLPHRLAAACQAKGIRLIHVSTDCVFSGRKGMYTENDLPDAEDFYGRSKLLGEITASGCLTLRTSVIGPEIGSAKGLLGWFLSNARKTKCLHGYTKAIFSGFTTLAFAEIIRDIIESFPELTGLYHLSADPVDKYSLLCLFREAYKIPVEIRPCADISIDRSLDSGRFRSATGFVPPSWPEMIASMSAGRVSIAQGEVHES